MSTATRYSAIQVRRALRRWRPAALAIAAIIQAGCRNDSSDLSGAGSAGNVRDSAGVRIVTHTSITSTPATIALATEPWLRLGGLHTNLDEELNASDPVPTRLADGRIAVTNRTSIKLFDTTGKYLGAIGREGPGPEEFRRITGLCRFPGDTLLVLEANHRRMSLWTADGKLILSTDAPRLVWSDPCFPDGTLFVERETADARDVRLVEPFLTDFYRAKLDGTKIADLGRLPVGDVGAISRTARLIPRLDRIHVADARTFEIRVQSHDGKLLQIIRVDTSLAPVTEERLRAELEKRFPPQRNREARIAAELSRPRPRTYPAYGRVELDPAGRIWVQSYDTRSQWTVFDSAGMLLGGVTMPTFEGVPGDIVMQDADGIAIRYRDADGASVLAFYRLVPASADDAR